MPRDTRILVIDDDANVLDAPNGPLGGCGYEVETASTGRAGIDCFRSAAFDVVLTELRLSDMNGFQILEQILAIDADAKVIVLTGHGSVRVAVDAVKAGAFHVVEKPFEPERLRLLVERALDLRALGASARRLRHVSSVEDRYGHIIGRSRPMQDLFAMIEAVAASDANILIVGESGTGKELIADAIHARSLRAKRDFVKINCSALPSDLIENELFGHVRGAFTGAARDKQGLIASATGGSLLLDEIGEMPVALQPKLLRVLQERQYARLGSEKLFKADFRLIASTNRPPEDAIRAGRLREDLYYRLSTITIQVPPLRERAGDVGLLADHLLKRFSGKYEKQIAGFSPAARAAMLDYRWPGNVRELENAIERAVLLTHGSTVGVEMLSHGAEHHVLAPVSVARAERTIAPPPPALVIASDDTTPLPVAEVGIAVPPGMTLAEIERNTIFQTLRHLRGNKKAAADSLGIYRPRLYAKIKHYNLTEFMPEERPAEAQLTVHAPRRRRARATKTRDSDHLFPIRSEYAVGAHARESVPHDDRV
jgi:two-component system, NtrC family, response regulator HydG